MFEINEERVTGGHTVNFQMLFGFTDVVTFDVFNKILIRKKLMAKEQKFNVESIFEFFNIK